MNQTANPNRNPHPTARMRTPHQGIWSKPRSRIKKKQIYNITNTISCIRQTWEIFLQP